MTDDLFFLTVMIKGSPTERVRLGYKTKDAADAAQNAIVEARGMSTLFDLSDETGTRLTAAGGDILAVLQRSMKLELQADLQIEVLKVEANAAFRAAVIARPELNAVSPFGGPRAAGQALAPGRA